MQGECKFDFENTCRCLVGACVLTVEVDADQHISWGRLITAATFMRLQGGLEGCWRLREVV